MKTGKELMPDIEKLGKLQNGRTSFADILQIGPHGVSQDYVGRWKPLYYVVRNTINELIHPDPEKSKFKRSHILDVNFDPSEPMEHARWKKTTQQYEGLDGAKEWLRFLAFGKYQNPAIGQQNSVFPLYAEYLRHHLNLYGRSWWEENGSKPLDLRRAAQLLFAENEDARRVHILSERIRSTLRKVVETGAGNADIEEIHNYAKKGLEIGYGEGEVII